MIKLLRKKLIDCGFVTNDISDKRARFEINEYLESLIFEQPKEIIKTAIDKFTQKYQDRDATAVAVKNKVPYFKKSINDALKELNVPNIDFGRSGYSENDINEAIIKIIEYQTIPVPSESFFGINYLEASLEEQIEFSNNPFYDMDDELFQRAIAKFQKNKNFYNPIVKRLLEMNTITDPNVSIADELDLIYNTLEDGPPKTKGNI